MGKKRKSIASRLDEVDRTMYSTFSSAASSLSQLYTQAMNQQKLSFQAGERHSLEKVYQWILRQIHEGSKVSVADMIAYLQNELDYGGEEASTSPRMQIQHQHSLPSVHFASTGAIQTPALSGQQTGSHLPRSGNSFQPKNAVFSNALSSPIRQSLQPYQLALGDYDPNNALPTGNGTRNLEGSSLGENRDSPSLNSTDSMMDMHSDSPARESDIGLYSLMKCNSRPPMAAIS